MLEERVLSFRYGVGINLQINSAFPQIKWVFYKCCKRLCWGKLTHVFWPFHLLFEAVSKTFIASKLKIIKLTHILPMLHFCTPKVFWRFQGVQKCNIWRIWVETSWIKLRLDRPPNVQSSSNFAAWVLVIKR